ETHAERQADRARSRISEATYRLAEIGPVIPVHTAHWRGRERVEGLVHRRIRHRCEHGLIDARQHYGSTVVEYRRRAAGTELIVVERVQDLHLSEQLESMCILQRVVIARGQIGPLLTFSAKGIAGGEVVRGVRPAGWRLIPRVGDVLPGVH